MSEKSEVEEKSGKKASEAWEEAERAWLEKYQKMSLQERKSDMLRSAWQSIRWQGESGLDKYAMFTPENYLSWKSFEPEIDEILEFVIETLAKMLMEDKQEFANKINGRLGRIK